MATMDDLERLALALPGVAKQLSGDGRPDYEVSGKSFCHHREARRDAVDAGTGERMQDVIVFRTADVDTKAVLLESRPEVYFTTPHFDGYPAILVRIPSLRHLSVDDLDDLLVEAWLSKAPKRVAKAWLAEQQADSPGG